jgi:hypothetical protein
MSNRGHQRAYLFIPHVIYMSMGEPWWDDDAGRGKLLTHLWQFYQQNNLGASRRNGRKEWQFYLASISFTLTSNFFTCRKTYDMGPLALLPIQSKVCCQFLSPLKVYRLGQVCTRNPWGPAASTLTTTPLRQRPSHLQQVHKAHIMIITIFGWKDYSYKNYSDVQP